MSYLDQIKDNDGIVLALDASTTNKKGKVSFHRCYYVCGGKDFKDHNLTADKFQKIEKISRLFKSKETWKNFEDVKVVLYPTKTYSEGFGEGLATPIAPEDRSVIRKLKSRFGDSKVSVASTSSEQVNTEEKKDKEKRFWIGFDVDFLKNIKSIFKSCMTVPNKQDYFYLLTKTFGVNLVVRSLFAIKGYQSGDLPLERAIASTSWYQIQDIVFTVFGQTYMKFLGKMTGMFRILNAKIGDFLFVYFQFCFFEFLNRLILGPIGENPIVYTWAGIGLIFLNNLQGLASGGPLVPAINKIRKAGFISHSTMMHFYQLGSLCFYFGLFASFGYQTIYALLTGSVMIFAWGSYITFSAFFKDPNIATIERSDLTQKFDPIVAKLVENT